MSFRGSDWVITKNIDALAYNGIILNKFYSANMCSPSRASLLTGKFPLNTGEITFYIYDILWYRITFKVIYL